MVYLKDRDDMSALAGFVIAIAILAAGITITEWVCRATGIDRLPFAPHAVAALSVASAVVCLLWLVCLAAAWLWGRRTYH